MSSGILMRKEGLAKKEAFDDPSFQVCRTAETKEYNGSRASGDGIAPSPSDPQGVAAPVRVDGISG
jgi:hypothetical protein